MRDLMRKWCPRLLKVIDEPLHVITKLRKQGLNASRVHTVFGQRESGRE
jgi:hypothetical protein